MRLKTKHTIHKSPSSIIKHNQKNEVVFHVTKPTNIENTVLIKSHKRLHFSNFTYGEMSRMANLQRQRDQWVKGLNQEVEMNENEHGVSVWGDKKALEMDSGDIPITL